MNTYARPAISSTPTFNSIRFRDGSILQSAEETEDFHVRKKFRTGGDSLFEKDVDIKGDLTIKGAVIIEGGSLPDTSQQYVNEQLEEVYTLIGWDSVNNRWKYTEYAQSAGTTLDARLLAQEDLYYTKSETDSRILNSSTLALSYYNGTSSKFTGDDGTLYSIPCSVVNTSNHFVVPKSLSSNLFIIQNSNYGSGKVLTSNSIGVATWESPNFATTIQNIVTANGQTSSPSFSIKDAISQTFEFIPNKLGNNYEVQQAGDATLRLNSGVLAITTGTNNAIVRPVGIRMLSTSNGFLELFGGWTFDGTNATTWDIDGGLNYLGTKIGTTIRFDNSGINMTHGYNQLIKLYGGVYIKRKMLNHPAYNRNSTDDFPPYLQVGDATYNGDFRVYGHTTTQSIKITNGATLNYVLTSAADGTASWQPPQASSTVSSFDVDVTFDEDITVLGTTNTEYLSLPNTLITSLIPTATYALVSDVTDTPPSQITWSTGSGNLERNTEYFSHFYNRTYGYADIPAHHKNSVDFIIPIFIQHNWCYTTKTGTNGYDNEIKSCVFNFGLYIASIDVHDTTPNGTLLYSYSYIDGPPGSKRLGSVVYEVDRSNSFSPSGNDINFARDEHAANVHMDRFELDRIPVHFEPPNLGTSKRYYFSINVQFRYYQTGPNLRDYVYESPTTKFPRAYWSFGSQGWLYFNVAGHASFTTHQSFTPPTLPPISERLVTFETNLYQPFVIGTGAVLNYYALYDVNAAYNEFYKRYVSIKHYYDDTTIIAITGYLNGKVNGNYRYETDYTYSHPLALTLSQITPSFNPAMHINNHLTSNTKNTEISIANIRKLRVGESIETQGYIYSRGIGGRRGIGSDQGNLHLFNSKSPRQTNIFKSSIINFYWNSGGLETWVDNTLVILTPPNYSDYRLKSNINKYGVSDVLFRLSKLPLFKYSIGQTDNHIGFFAHEMQDLFPDFPNLVSGTKDAVENDTIIPQTVNYNELTSILLKAVQELNRQVIILRLQFTLLAIAFILLLWLQFVLVRPDLLSFDWFL